MLSDIRRGVIEQSPLFSADDVMPLPCNPDAIAIGLDLLAKGQLQLRSQRSLPMPAAAEAHRLLEDEGVREKLLLTTAALGSGEREATND